MVEGTALPRGGPRSEPRARLRQVKRFLRRIGTAQHGVAMGKAVEAHDHLALPSSIAEKHGVALALFGRRLRAQGFEQHHRMRLQAHVLGVFQRQVGEYPAPRRQRLIEAVGAP